MKSVSHLNNSAISKEDLQKVKGGNNGVAGIVVVVEKQLDITSGNNLLYCDRRRKLINC